MKLLYRGSFAKPLYREGFMKPPHRGTYGVTKGFTTPLYRGGFGFVKSLEALQSSYMNWASQSPCGSFGKPLGSLGGFGGTLQCPINSTLLFL